MKAIAYIILYVGGFLMFVILMSYLYYRWIVGMPHKEVDELLYKRFMDV